MTSNIWRAATCKGSEASPGSSWGDNPYKLGELYSINLGLRLVWGQTLEIQASLAPFWRKVPYTQHLLRDQPRAENGSLLHSDQESSRPRLGSGLQSFGRLGWAGTIKLSVLGIWSKKSKKMWPWVVGAEDERMPQGRENKPRVAHADGS